MTGADSRLSGLNPLQVLCYLLRYLRVEIHGYGYGRVFLRSIRKSFVVYLMKAWKNRLHHH